MICFIDGKAKMGLSLWKIQVHSYESLSLRKKQNRLLYWASLYMLRYNDVKNLNNSISEKQQNVNLSFLKKKKI